MTSTRATIIALLLLGTGLGIGYAFGYGMGHAKVTLERGLEQARYRILLRLEREAAFREGQAFLRDREENGL